MPALRFEVARVTIQLTSPLHIGTGEGDALRDALGVADANGLPAIPGTSLAGILRHALAGGTNPDTYKRCCQAFGYQEHASGQSSRVEVSWAQTHGAANRPVPFHGAAHDDVLSFLRAGVTRDHVRINSHGVADGRGKFDETVVATGARFTFELVVRDDAGVSASELIDLLACRHLRLGGRTRRGLGAFDVQNAWVRSFDLSKAGDRRAWGDWPRAIERQQPEPSKFLPYKPKPTVSADVLEGSLRVEPLDYWIVGGGVANLPEHGREVRGQTKVHDMVPLTERRIEWTEQGGRVSAWRHIAPGSGIKGALRHRTGFHARRINKQWIGTGNSDEPAEVRALFGEIKSADQGIPGRVFVDDYWAPAGAATGALDHVSIDRFSGGPIDGALFSEAPLWRGVIDIPIVVDLRGLEACGPDLAERARRALRCALDDLCEGRLAVGAGANRGHGYMQKIGNGADIRESLCKT